MRKLGAGAAPTRETKRVVLAAADGAHPRATMLTGAPRLAAAALVATTSVVVYLLLRRRRVRCGRLPRVLACYPCEVHGRPWYRHVVVTEQATDGRTVTRGLHLGSAANTPESVVRLERIGDELRPMASVLEKAYAPFALLPFALAPDSGFAPDSRACLVGVAGGSLLHCWLGCVPGGDTLRVDAVELDGAVLRAAREHLGLGCCERTGRVALHQADGVAFLAAAEDEVYDVLMIDLDMGSLFRAGEGARAARQAARDVYRVLSERGLLIVNEYSESAAHERMEAMLRSVRALRHHFAEVHVVRTTPHNLLFVATVERAALPGGGGGPATFERLCAAADGIRFGGGLEVDLGQKLRELGAKSWFCSPS